MNLEAEEKKMIEQKVMLEQKERQQRFDALKKKINE